MCGLIWWPECTLWELLSPKRIYNSLTNTFKPLSKLGK